jgi:UDP-N-acetylglucosamine--N-acetylmuramyl-(pentapeptide) pyrophosphoryl-undecaprenol N-acetylglucosamine transferase
MTHEIRHLVLSGGVTGGHLFPGLAVAEAVRTFHPTVRVTFAGRGSDWERDQIATAGFDYLTLACHAWPRRPWRWPRFVINQISGLRHARAWLRRQQVDAVVGLGGYASVPMALAASGVALPLLLLEQNARPGRATRFLAPRAQHVCAAFAESRPWLSIEDQVFQVTGNPLRSAFARLQARHQAVNAAVAGNSDPCNKRRLLVLGGSRGSTELNRIVPSALARLPQLADWQIVHQAGSQECSEVAKRYAAAGLSGRVVGFVDDLPQELTTADLVVCRAGGTTLAELAAVGVPAILCPWDAAADDHQRHNARVLASAGACRMVELARVADPAQELAMQVSNLLADARQRRELIANLRMFARPAAAQSVVKLIERLVIENATGKDHSSHAAAA